MMPHSLTIRIAPSVAGELLLTSLAWRRSRPLALLGLAARALTAALLYRAIASEAS